MQLKLKINKKTQKNRIEKTLEVINRKHTKTRVFYLRDVFLVEKVGWKAFDSRRLLCLLR